MLSVLCHDILGSNLGALACKSMRKRALSQVSQLGSRYHHVGHWRDYYSNSAAQRPGSRGWAAGSFRTARVADQWTQLIYQLCVTVQFLSSQFAPMKQQF
jgi:hypothetical protein